MADAHSSSTPPLRSNCSDPPKRPPAHPLTPTPVAVRLPPSGVAASPHRRSHSDVPLGFLPRIPLIPDSRRGLFGDPDDLNVGDSGGESSSWSSGNLGEGTKRIAEADPVPIPRRRSFGMDSLSPRFNYQDVRMEFGYGEFSATEMKKVLTDESLTEIALTDPKKAKRILANRLSAARSKERKARYIADLERKVQTLQAEATRLSAQLTALQRNSDGLSSQNNELKFRLQAMQQQAHLKDALNENLTAEVQRLKLTAGMGEAYLSNSLNRFQLDPHLFQLQQLQKQQEQQHNHDAVNKSEP